ncbi:MAG: hypothetical protein H9535_06585 [Ignavibacteria bacterium]|nr:hypothetical protein [Ignavibacteria bacterium]
MLRRALVVLLMSASSLPLAAQVAGVSPLAEIRNESAKEKINAEEAPTSVFPDSRLSAGVGAIFLPTDKISPGFLLSAMYSRSLLPGLEVEAAVQHHSGVSTTRFVSSVSPRFVLAADEFNNFYSWNCTSVDMAMLFSPAPVGFRFGIGATVQVREQTSATDILNFTQGSRPQFYHYQNVSLGGNIKVDYLLPLSPILDAGLRAQWHVLFASGIGYEPPRIVPDMQGSALAFLSVRF